MHYQILAAFRRRWKTGDDEGFIFEFLEIRDLFPFCKSPFDTPVAMNASIELAATRNLYGYQQFVAHC